MLKIYDLLWKGNEISKVEGFEGLRNLHELVLDRNKIKMIGEFSFIGQNKLEELHLEENRLLSLSNFTYLENIQRLYLGLNKINVSSTAILNIWKCDTNFFFEMFQIVTVFSVVFLKISFILHITKERLC